MTKKDSDKDCSICFKKIKRKNRVVTTCDHIFHFTCLFKNLKYNYNTGDCCPLCRKSFLSSTITIINPLATRINPSLFQPIRQVQPIQEVSAAANTYRQTNRVIHHARRQEATAQRRRQIFRSRMMGIRQRRPRSIPETNSPTVDQVSKYISELSFHELKCKLKERGLSARGYLRTSLEERLSKSMRSQ